MPDTRVLDEGGGGEGCVVQPLMPVMRQHLQAVLCCTVKEMPCLLEPGF